MISKTFCGQWILNSEVQFVKIMFEPATAVSLNPAVVYADNDDDKV